MVKKKSKVSKEASKSAEASSKGNNPTSPGSPQGEEQSKAAEPSTSTESRNSLQPSIPQSNDGPKAIDPEEAIPERSEAPKSPKQSVLQRIASLKRGLSGKDKKSPKVGSPVGSESSSPKKEAITTPKSSAGLDKIPDPAVSTKQQEPQLSEPVGQSRGGGTGTSPAEAGKTAASKSDSAGKASAESAASGAKMTSAEAARRGSESAGKTSAEPAASKPDSAGKTSPDSAASGSARTAAESAVCRSDSAPQIPPALSTAEPTPQTKPDSKARTPLDLSSQTPPVLKPSPTFRRSATYRRPDWQGPVVQSEVVKFEEDMNAQVSQSRSPSRNPSRRVSEEGVRSNPSLEQGGPITPAQEREPPEDTDISPTYESLITSDDAPVSSSQAEGQITPESQTPSRLSETSVEAGEYSETQSFEFPHLHQAPPTLRGYSLSPRAAPAGMIFRGVQAAEAEGGNRGAKNEQRAEKGIEIPGLRRQLSCEQAHLHPRLVTVAAGFLIIAGLSLLGLSFDSKRAFTLLGGWLFLASAIANAASAVCLLREDMEPDWRPALLDTVIALLNAAVGVYTVFIDWQSSLLVFPLGIALRSIFHALAEVGELTYQARRLSLTPRAFALAFVGAVLLWFWRMVPLPVLAAIICVYFILHAIRILRVVWGNESENEDYLRLSGDSV